jgi:hypothetical protein
MFLLGFIVLGIAIGLLRGGSLWSLSNLHFRSVWLIPLGVVLQFVALSGVLPPLPDWGDPSPVVHVLSYCALLAGLVLNWRLWPLRMLTLGGLANFAAIVENGGYMPASPAAMQTAGTLERFQASARDNRLSNSVLMDDHTALPWLGDVFALPADWPLANIFSVGDVLIGLGACLLIVESMGQRQLVAREA